MTLIELEPVDYYCEKCDSAMEWTACHAPYCLGYRCLNCDCGCDLHAEPEDGECARSLANLPLPLAQEIRDERLRLLLMRGRFPGECA